ncbi:MAG: hypothetical protein M3162_09135 [Thermoproteota archaeon]|nr:hypothetical protein [Thermoproteota archaeon]
MASSCCCLFFFLSFVWNNLLNKQKEFLYANSWVDTLKQHHYHHAIDDSIIKITANKNNSRL